MKKFIHGVLIGYSAATLLFTGSEHTIWRQSLLACFWSEAGYTSTFTTTFTDKDSEMTHFLLALSMLISAKDYKA